MNAPQIASNMTQDYMTATRAAATPYIVGVVDAQQGRFCNPSQYDKDGDRAAYREGYVDEVNAIALYGKDGDGIQATVDALFAPAATSEPDPIDYAAELEEYLDDIEDRNIWRRGAW